MACTDNRIGLAGTIKANIINAGKKIGVIACNAHSVTRSRNTVQLNLCRRESESLAIIRAVDALQVQHQVFGTGLGL